MGFSMIPVIEPRFIHGLQEDGLRLALLLRLSPVLPIPFDSYWCGVYVSAGLVDEIAMGKSIQENDHYLHEYFSHVQVFMKMNLWTMALGLKLGVFDRIL